ncbi:hypothetical protein CWB96_21995 [Pseudoalteromonas citrea]|uniref:Outer membrane protein beta-barrel domain-containing protein n=1 Tax=Pseudoalteromonas citrea TaxID=43655 RepID=A0A5S3XG21_9GAMM|nr:hypothetical protein CWB97_12275 [Pseudoalteromonas citrea]TMP52072.1 hypothetical protein CWB96_21995 [Pseudoalteromonas citrea]
MRLVIERVKILKIFLIGLSVLFATTHAYSAPLNTLETGLARLALPDLEDLQTNGAQIALARDFESFYLKGSYVQLSGDIEGNFTTIDGSEFIKGKSTFNFDIDFIEFGIGKKFTLSDTSYLDLQGYVTRVYLDITGYEHYVQTLNDGTTHVVYDGAYSEKDTADLITLEVNYRAYFNDVYLEFGLGATSEASNDIKRLQKEGGDTSTLLSLELGYNITSSLGANVRYQKTDEYNAVSGNLSYRF